MTSWITDRIIQWLCQKKLIETGDEESVCRYGCEATVYTLLSTTGLLLESLLLGRLIDGVCIIILFYLNQSVGGGFHATSHRKCFCIMIMGLFLSLRMEDTIQNRWLWLAVGFIAIFIMFQIPLVLHTNKQYLHAKQIELKSRARKIVIVEWIALILLVCVESNPLCFRRLLLALRSALSLEFVENMKVIGRGDN